MTVGPILGEFRDAEAEGHGDDPLLAGFAEALDLDLVSQGLGEEFRLLSRRAGEDDEELVAAIAPDQVMLVTALAQTPRPRA